MRFFPLSETDRKDILKFLEIDDISELFSDIPREHSYYDLDKLPPALPENRLIDNFRQLAGKNTFSRYTHYLGGGAYDHFIPEVVNHLSSKGEFLTPYTPYQPEVSQGSLQAMFEYQTMMTMLTGMDISNSSLYDGGTAAAEGVLLAIRKSKKNRFIMAENLNPEYIEIIRTYVQNLNLEFKTVAIDPSTGQVDLSDLERKADPDTAAFIFQSPNIFGVIEDVNEISTRIHEKGGYSIQVITEAMSLAFLKPPGENNVDIALGEAQSFGLPLGFGGPYLGFLTARKEFLRQMPGRIVGETVDTRGRRGYVLTLSTREQHIKREKATSNICTNQAWCALRTAMYLATMGKSGLEKIGKTNHLNTAYFVKSISGFKHVEIRYKTNYFNEVVLDIKNMRASDFLQKMKKKQILAGIPLKWFYPEFQDSVLMNFTEKHKTEDIDRLVNSIGELK